MRSLQVLYTQNPKLGYTHFMIDPRSFSTVCRNTATQVDEGLGESQASVPVIKLIPKTNLVKMSTTRTIRCSSLGYKWTWGLW